MSRIVLTPEELRTAATWAARAAAVTVARAGANPPMREELLTASPAP